MPHRDDGIIHPSQQAVSFALGPMAVMAATLPDRNSLRNLLWKRPPKGHAVAMSHLYPNTDQCPVSLVGPMMGAPYAVYLLESLFAWGVRQVFFLGWCGAVSPEVRIGDIIVPDSAFIDEGTSVHYHPPPSMQPEPSRNTVDAIKNMLESQHLAFREGPVWCTDAIFRETPEKLNHFQTRGAIAVEMEVSALFTVGRFRQMEVGALLIVSDDISSSSWQPGFTSDRFRETRRAACKGLATLCQSL